MARGAIEGDARFDPVEDECIALGVRDADVGLGVNSEVDRAAVAKLAGDDGASELPAPFVREQRMIADDPQFVIGKVDCPPVLIPASPRVRADQDDELDPARLGCLHMRRIEKASQDACDLLDLALLAADEMADARSEERSVGKECVSTGRSRGSPLPEKTNF